MKRWLKTNSKQIQRCWLWPYNQTSVYLLACLYASALAWLHWTTCFTLIWFDILENSLIFNFVSLSWSTRSCIIWCLFKILIFCCSLYHFCLSIFFYASYNRRLSLSCRSIMFFLKSYFYSCKLSVAFLIFDMYCSALSWQSYYVCSSRFLITSFFSLFFSSSSIYISF